MLLVYRLLRNSYTETHGGVTEMHREIKEIVFLCSIAIMNQVLS